MRHRSSPKKHSRYSVLYILLVAFLLGYALYKGVLTVQRSLFIDRPDRINMVIYGPETMYYSIDMHAARHYLIPFSAELKVDVPGGYGQYRIGSLGKLAKLDDNRRLIEKVFATTTTTFIHYYFYPDTDEVYYGGVLSDKKKPSIRSVLFSPGNASLLDRVYLSFMLLGKSNNEFFEIAYQKEKDEVLGAEYFQDESFTKKSIGLLYQDTYREEGRSTQILYEGNYRTAQRMSGLLEGNGIRVSDISHMPSSDGVCRIVYSGADLSETAKDIALYFSCSLQQGKTDVYDILFILGSLEDEWEIVN